MLPLRVLLFAVTLVAALPLHWQAIATNIDSSGSFQFRKNAFSRSKAQSHQSLHPDDRLQDHLRQSLATFQSIWGASRRAHDDPQRLATQEALQAQPQSPDFEYTDADIQDVRAILPHPGVGQMALERFQKSAAAEAAALRQGATAGSAGAAHTQFGFGQPPLGIREGGGPLFGRVDLPVPLSESLVGIDDGGVVGRQHLRHDWCAKRQNRDNVEPNTKASLFHVYVKDPGGYPKPLLAFCGTNTSTAMNADEMQGIELHMDNQPHKLLACSHSAVDLTMQNRVGYLDDFAICIVGEESAELLALWIQPSLSDVVEVRIESRPMMAGVSTVTRQVPLKFHLHHDTLSTIEIARRSLWRNFRLNYGKPGTRMEIEAQDLYFVANVTVPATASTNTGNVNTDQVCHLSAHQFQLVFNSSHNTGSREGATTLAKTTTVINLEDTDKIRSTDHCVRFHIRQRPGRSNSGEDWKLCLDSADDANALAVSITALRDIFAAEEFAAPVPAPA